MNHPIDFPDTCTNAELANLIAETLPLCRNDAEREDVERRMDAVNRAPRWARVRTRDAGQKGDVVVGRGGRVAWYRPAREVREDEPGAIPNAAIRRAFSESMQRAMWGCVA